MAVYFLRYGETIKIGVAEDVESRVLHISASFPGLELVAQCDGGADVERALHRIFEPARIEGEWFKSTPFLETVIDTFESGVSGRRVFGEQASRAATEDQEIARNLLLILMEKQSGGTLTKIEAAFQVLSKRNPIWTRRRVRAIWNFEAKRIDLFEVRDLTAATGDCDVAP